MITPIYAALLTFILIFLILQVIKLRRKYSVGLGDGGHHDLTQAIRSHGNFVETAPWALLLMFLVEFQDGSLIALHIMGLTIVIGRCLHIYALKRSNLSFRVAGMVCTISVLALGALYNLFLAFTVGV